ncbi:hypothetical protein F5X96DRAFT_675200 [Biscogniauxia mediterranea]|nr:hypothetical protein F5X96DRAFT_675200 [Biscogniauxia mediterranea]
MTSPADSGQVNIPDNGVSPLVLSSFDAPLDTMAFASDSHYHTSPGNRSFEYCDFDRRGGFSSPHGDMHYGLDTSDMFDQRVGFNGQNIDNVDNSLTEAATGQLLGRLENETLELQQYTNQSFDLSNEALMAASGPGTSSSSSDGRSSSQCQEGAQRLSSISSSCASPEESGASYKTAKQKRDRERNRVAAHKCRQKAKQSVEELQIRERELSQRNKVLVGHAGCLREEILGLKIKILQHSSCDSEIIQNYIAKAARDI